MPGSGVTWVQTEVATTTTLWTYNPSLVLLCSQAEIMFALQGFSGARISSARDQERAGWEHGDRLQLLRLNWGLPLQTGRSLPEGEHLQVGRDQILSPADAVQLARASADQTVQELSLGHRLQRLSTDSALNVKLLQPLTLPKGRSPHARLLPIAYWSCTTIV